MKKLTRITLLLALIGAGIPSLHAGYRGPQVIRGFTIDKNPSVIAAKKRHKEAEAALDEAKKSRDKAAIEAAQKEHDETQRALTKARNNALAAGRKQQQQQRRR